MFTARRVSHTAAIFAAACATALAIDARAVDITLDNESAEAQHRSSNGAYAMSQAQPWSGMRVGTQSGFGGPDSGFGLGGIEAIMFFKLPAVPAGQSLSTASLTFSLLKNSESNPQAPAFNVDLYALGFDKNTPPNNDGAAGGYGSGGVTSATVAPAYFYVGTDQTPSTITAVNPSNVPLAKIQDDILTPTDWNAAQAAADSQVVRSSTAAGNTALLNYIASLYANPNFTPDHDYLVLRMNPDIDPVNTSTRRYQIPFAQTPTFDDGGAHAPTSTTATVPTLSITFASSHITGDTNNDGVVDLNDLNNVLNNFGNNTPGNPGDENGDNTVDLNDLNNVLNHFGSHAAASALAVPEPASLAACGLAVLPLLRRRRRA